MEENKIREEDNPLFFKLRKLISLIVINISKQKLSNKPIIH
jgi:hypothetical protein